MGFNDGETCVKIPAVLFIITHVTRTSYLPSLNPFLLICERGLLAPALLSYYGDEVS